jgi:predicted dehydrogenase
MLDSGGIGRIREVHGEFLKFALRGDESIPPAPRIEEEKLRQWKLWRSTFGEVVVETYVHTLDAINWFMNARPLTALGTGGRKVEKRGDLLDRMSVTYDYPGNVQVTNVPKTPSTGTFSLLSIMVSSFGIPEAGGARAIHSPNYSKPQRKLRARNRCDRLRVRTEPSQG